MLLLLVTGFAAVYKPLSLPKYASYHIRLGVASLVISEKFQCNLSSPLFLFDLFEENKIYE